MDEHRNRFSLYELLAFLAFLAFLVFIIHIISQQKAAPLTTAEIEKAREIIRRMS